LRELKPRDRHLIRSNAKLEWPQGEKQQRSRSFQSASNRENREKARESSRPAVPVNSTEGGTRTINKQKGVKRREGRG